MGSHAEREYRKADGLGDYQRGTTMYAASTDLELAQLIREDDREAYAELYRRYAMPLLHHAYNKMRSREDAKDTVQEVFATVWDKRRQLSVDQNVAGFLYASVRNSILNQIAREEVAGRYLASMERFVRDGAPPADHAVREKEFAQLIESEIARLTPRMREVFELSRAQHLSHREIAAKLGMSEQTVSKHMTNALRILRERLGVYYLVCMIYLF